MMLDTALMWCVAVFVGLVALVGWVSFCVELRQPKAKRSMLASHFIFSLLLSYVFFHGADLASRSSFSTPPDGYQFWGGVSPEHLSNKLGMPGMCVLDNTPESELCLFLMKANSTDEQGPTLLVIHNNRSYLIRSGNWPFDTVVEVPKSTLTL